MVTKKKTVKKTVTKTKSKKGKKPSKSKGRKKAAQKDNDEIDSGIVIVDDDLVVDIEAELEERRAFLEEARSQEASSD